MVATPDFGGATFDDSDPLAGSDRALGLVDFSLFPHLEREDMPDTSLADIEGFGSRDIGTGVRDRRSDRHQSDRWCGRSRLRGALEAALPRPGGKPIGLRRQRRARLCQRARRWKPRGPGRAGSYSGGPRVPPVPFAQAEIANSGLFDPTCADSGPIPGS